MGTHTPTIPAAASRWLADTIARNRALYGGWSMEADPDDPPADPPAGDPPADLPPADDPPLDPAADAGKGGKEAVLADLAKERGKRQELEQRLNDIQAAQQSQMDAIATALGLKQADTPPDPAALTAEIETERAAARAAQVELAIYKAAPAAEADAARLLDSASFLRSLADVDPTDAVAVQQAIAAAVETNPHLKAAAATPPPSTPPFPGGPRSTPPARAASLTDAIASRFGQPTR